MQTQHVATHIMQKCSQVKLLHKSCYARVLDSKRQFLNAAVRCGSFRCGSLRCGSFRCGSLRCGSFRCGSFRCGSFRCGSFRCGSFRCGSFRRGSLHHRARGACSCYTRGTATCHLSRRWLHAACPRVACPRGLCCVAHGMRCMLAAHILRCTCRALHVSCAAHVVRCTRRRWRAAHAWLRGSSVSYAVGVVSAVRVRVQLCTWNAARCMLYAVSLAHSDTTSSPRSAARCSSRRKSARRR